MNEEIDRPGERAVAKRKTDDVERERDDGCVEDIQMIGKNAYSTTTVARRTTTGKLESDSEKIDRIDSNMRVLHSQMSKLDKKINDLEIAINHCDSRSVFQSGKFSWVGNTGVCGCCVIIGFFVTSAFVIVMMSLIVASLFI